jgi:hypothetical protein
MILPLAAAAGLSGYGTEQPRQSCVFFSWADADHTDAVLRALLTKISARASRAGLKSTPVRRGKGGPAAFEVFGERVDVTVVADGYHGRCAIAVWPDPRPFWRRPLFRHWGGDSEDELLVAVIEGVRVVLQEEPLVSSALWVTLAKWAALDLPGIPDGEAATEE